jgi:hypothetical protein
MKKTKLTKLQRDIAIALWHCKPLAKMRDVKEYELWCDIRANIANVLEISVNRNDSSEQNLYGQFVRQSVYGPSWGKK